MVAGTPSPSWLLPSCERGHCSLVTQGWLGEGNRCHSHKRVLPLHIHARPLLLEGDQCFRGRGRRGTQPLVAQVPFP